MEARQPFLETAVIGIDVLDVDGALAACPYPFAGLEIDGLVRNAMGAAKSVGDDEIQKKSGGGINPESWTHGSAAARQKWFMTGYEKGDLNSCDTFNVDSVE